MLTVLVFMVSRLWPVCLWRIQIVTCHVTSVCDVSCDVLYMRQVERELRAQQLLQDKRLKKEQEQFLRYADMIKKAQERELRRQQEMMLKEQVSGTINVQCWAIVALFEADEKAAVAAPAGRRFDDDVTVSSCFRRRSVGGSTCWSSRRWKRARSWRTRSDCASSVVRRSESSEK